MSTLAVIYFEKITHSYALAMLVFSLSALITMFLEIPFGIMSDKIGRKKTLIAGSFCFFLSFLLWALAGQLSCVPLLFAGAVFWGASDALFSGTEEALMYETMEDLNAADEFDLLFSKARFFNQIGLALSALSAIVITYFFDLLVLAWISVFPVFGELLLSFFYVEPRQRMSHKQSSWQHFLMAFRKLWKNKKLRFWAFVQMSDTAVGMASFRFESAYYALLLPDWLVNAARLLKQVCGSISFWIVRKIRHFQVEKVFFVSLFFNAFLRLIGVVMNNFVSPFLMSGVNLFYGTGLSSGEKILQKEFSPAQRATMKSIISGGKSVLMAGVMFLLGVLADLFGARFVIFAAVVFKFVIFFFSVFFLKKKKCLQ